MFVEIIERKKLKVGHAVSGLSKVSAWKVQRTPASFPSALIVDRWMFVGAAGWSVLTLMVASGSGGGGGEVEVQQ